MRKAVEFDLEYRIDGERKIKHLTIDFISRRSIQMFENIISQSADVKIKWERMKEIESELTYLKIEKPDGWKDKQSELQGEYKDLIAKISEYKESDFFDERFQLLLRILTDNGYKDEKFQDYLFWDECVDPLVQMEFLTAVIYKDIDSKKKIV